MHIIEHSEDVTLTGTEKKKNTTWTDEMDKCLIEALVLQCNKGHKVDKGFKEVAYIAAADILKSSFNKNITKENVINRMKTIKQNYREIEAMLAQSGFSFNYISKKIECMDAVWETFFKAHPKAKYLRYKKIEMLEELGIFCGNDRATGKWSRGGPNINGKRTETSMHENEMDADTDVEYSLNDNISLSSIRAASLKQQKLQGRRSKNGEAYIEKMKTVASSIKDMADAIKGKSELQSKKVTDPTMLLNALQEIEELKENDVFDIFETLLADEIKAKTFMTYPTKMRITFLKRNFGIGRSFSYNCDDSFELGD